MVKVNAQGHATEGSRPTNSVRNALAAFLHFYSPQCVVCAKVTVIGLADSMHNAFQVGHIVPGGPKRMGWVAGNLATMCRACNNYIGDRDVTEFIPRFKNAEGIPSEWPSNKVLLEMFPVQQEEGAEESIRICEEIFN